jgi:hypothetical protein
MTGLTFSMPDGWPVSLWFFVITAIVFLLQLFPLTGVFLMLVLAAFWSAVLINLGMVGIVVEGMTGRVSLTWLLIPALYFGGYYWAYFSDQNKFAFVVRENAAFNAGKSLAFDEERQDVLIEDPKDGLGVGAAEFTENYGLPRAFDGQGRVFLIGTKDTCELMRDNPVFASAGIQSHSVTRRESRRAMLKSTGFCTIMMPGKPDKPVVRITQSATSRTYGRLPVTLRDLTARDDANGTTVSVRTGRASPLKPFPWFVMGFALNSAAPKWQGFAGFMRDTAEITPHLPRYSSGMPLLATMLGLEKSEDLAGHAIGPDRFKPMADRADADLVAEELAQLEAALANPLAPVKGAWFRHLPNRPDVLAPYAGRIFEALGTLQSADFNGVANGRNLWGLVAVLPEPALAPHRAQMVEWMKPGAIREWTAESWQVFARLDVRDPVQRDIVLTKLEKPRGDLPGSLLTGFCKMGAAAPQDGKDRLLAIWRARGAVTQERGGDRGIDHIQLYLTLARMGMKQQAGKVEQRYFGPTFAGIWDEITPDSPADICDLSTNDLSNRYRL